VQAFDAGLLSIAGLTTLADRSIYTTASDTYAVYTLTAAGRAILDDADATAQRTTLGLGNLATVTASAFALTILDDADAAAVRTTIGAGTGDMQKSENLSGLANYTTARSNMGLAIGTNVQAYDAGLQSIAGLTTAADTMIYTTASDTYATATLTAFGRSLIDDANQAAGQTTLGYTAADVLAKLITVDGAGSNLDADLLDGVQGSSYARLDLANTFAGTTTSDARVGMRRGGNNYEWGHPTAAYVATLGAEAGSGAPFWLVGGEAGTTSNTYRTRGILAAGARGNNLGGIIWFTLTNSNADNQSPTDRMTLLASGELQLTDVGPTSTLAGGTKAVVRNRQDSSYTLVLADAGKSIVGYGSTASQTWTIPANGSVAYPIGTSITFINLRSVSCSVACTTDTMYLAGAGTTGTRTLASYGWCTAVKTDTTNWIIGGTGLT
jgi:hypothetical protein